VHEEKIRVTQAYNQWSGPTRQSRYREYKAARRAGEIPPPGPCEMCGQTIGTMHHAEDYGPTRDAYFAALHSLCGRCHAWLHLRFRFPGYWAAYKQRCRAGPRLPAVKSMAEVFGTWRRSDIPVVEYPHHGAWWEVLSTERSGGPLV